MATPPRSTAGVSRNEPPSRPNAVRAELTMTISSTRISFEAAPRVRPLSSSGGGCGRRSRLRLQSQQTSDHHALHLIGALADLSALAVAPIPRDGELFHHPVSAVDL